MWKGFKGWFYQRRDKRITTLNLYSTLLDSLSHELRTPLSALIGAVDNLMEEPSVLSKDDQQKLLSVIAGASMRLNRLVENLLHISRLENGTIGPQKTWCELHELIAQAVQQLEEPLAGHLLLVECPEKLPLFKLDFGWMEQVLVNLIHNACLYTPEGSQILIRADCPDENLVIIVEDNGKGIPAEESKRIFDKFYRAPGSRPGGTGLGLSIVKGFVEAHGGHIALERPSQGGARFIIRLPVEKLTIKLTGKWAMEKY